MTSLMMNLRRLFILALLLAAAGLLAAACGSGEDAPTPDNSTGMPEGDNAVTLRVTLLDSYFEPDQFTVQTGQTVTFDITNEGQLVHNMRIAGPDGEGLTEDDVVSEPNLIEGGQSGVLVWTAPEPGVYAFRCDVHPDSGGVIVVEQGDIS